jgi:S1-C subfamily serine protease
MGTSVLEELSQGLAAVVESAQSSIVRVNARRRVGATGVVWRADGLVVTADHVIEREDEITVGLPDGRDLPARIVGRDQGTDVAVLRVEATGLTPFEPAQGAARVGSLVLALGRPYGETAMASFGVVSAVGGNWRTWRGGNIQGVVRSDVTLYPGFSGGPLVDATGRLIGINSSALARGLAVTLPYEALSRIVETLVSGGSVKRGFLGVATQPVALPESLRSALGLEQQTGLLVINVEPGSPAERAGLLLGDTLVGFGDRTIDDITALQDVLAGGSAGTAQQARIVRAGQLIETAVTVGER